MGQYLVADADGYFVARKFKCHGDSATYQICRVVYDFSERRVVRMDFSFRPTTEAEKGVSFRPAQSSEVAELSELLSRFSYLELMDAVIEDHGFEFRAVDEMPEWAKRRNR